MSIALHIQYFTLYWFNDEVGRIVRSIIGFNIRQPFTTLTFEHQLNLKTTYGLH